MLIDAPPTLLNTIMHNKHLSHLMAKSMNELAYKSPLIPLLTSSPLNKIGIIDTQRLQEKRIFPMMPRSEWLVQWSVHYAQKCSEVWVENSEQNLLPLHEATQCIVSRGLSSTDHILAVFEWEAIVSPAEVQSLQQKDKKRRKRKGKKKNLKKPKSWRCRWCFCPNTLNSLQTKLF